MQLDTKLSREVNIGHSERWASLLVGSLLLVYGFARSFRGLVWLVLGGALFYRGLSGHSYLYHALGLDAGGRRATWAWPGGPGIRVEESIVVRRPVEEVYRFWRNLENLPRVMGHVVSVTPMGERRSRWVVRAPGPVRATVEWEGEIVEERENELITWRSYPGSQVDVAGSVFFRPTPAGDGTEIRVMLAYSPPGGAVGTAVGRLLNPMTADEIRADLRQFRDRLEAGEVLMGGATEGEGMCAEG
ncbi:MAG: DUF2892 domain-containing protein [Anaerolineae bacterium]|nr:DUF2892 domain-containing protein [Anaerolineae bacterium]